MAALVPARPPEEEEEEEEEKVNHAMEREPTGMDGDDIRSDMEYEYTNAQSLDDPDHTTMAALVQAPVGHEDSHAMMPATLPSQSLDQKSTQDKNSRPATIPVRSEWHSTCNQKTTDSSNSARAQCSRTPPIKCLTDTQEA
ncbi:uncharacterized protein AKAW2_50412A [Aspergillus luchuensis]|uniref:Uncharacterized protein n=1 Tax=Aspergillus kawachii TaxID=1069201 RepID=A0A7R7ZZF8_ASPKA|nr:uncharacterized protein AKAW2_50412A [Aspergillus luchuensis]BCS00071.1 hypothetical protein AKAW2_50412A [Aspergillus luchuensis]